MGVKTLSIGPRASGSHSRKTGHWILKLLADRNCQTILASIGDGHLSVKEISKICDLPLSTTYRKIDQLTGTDLIEESIRIRRSGKHANEYTTPFNAVDLTLRGDDRMRIRLELE